MLLAPILTVASEYFLESYWFVQICPYYLLRYSLLGQCSIPPAAASQVKSEK